MRARVSEPMFEKTLQATHPDMMRGADAAGLAERYLVPKPFSAEQLLLTYCHVERFVIGGAAPVRAPRPTNRPSFQ